MNKKQKIDFFKKEVNRFIKFFGLLDYEIVFSEDGDNSFRGVCQWHSWDSEDADAQNIVIYYSRQWINDNISKSDISKVAFHEVMEILFHKLFEMAIQKDIYISEREIRTERHRIIRILENTIWGKI